MYTCMCMQKHNANVYRSAQCGLGMNHFQGFLNSHPIFHYTSLAPFNCFKTTFYFRWHVSKLCKTEISILYVINSVHFFPINNGFILVTACTSSKCSQHWSLQIIFICKNTKYCITENCLCLCILASIHTFFPLIHTHIHVNVQMSEWINESYICLFMQLH